MIRPQLLTLGTFLSSTLLAACGNSDRSAASTSPPSAPAPSSPRSSAAPLAIAGMWQDDMGDAPWGVVELARRTDASGTFAVRPRSCERPPCAPTDEGTYDLDGRTLSLHSKKLEGKVYAVHLAGDIMEWRDDDVVVRRFKLSVPPAPPIERDPYPLPGAARPTGTPCGELTAQACLLATDCVLEPPVKPAHDYVCRAAVAPCEGGVAQADARFVADCNARPTCAVRRGDCFCPNASTGVSPPPGSPEERSNNVGVACACGGGPYQQCLPTK